MSSRAVVIARPEPARHDHRSQNRRLSHESEIAHKGNKAPIQASQRWHVERTNADERFLTEKVNRWLRLAGGRLLEAGAPDA
ncbi:hypothetical protein GCM10029978_066590 [Actinoallomurus acanthiterrae]